MRLIYESMSFIFSIIIVLICFLKYQACTRNRDRLILVHYYILYMFPVEMGHKKICLMPYELGHE